MADRRGNPLLGCHTERFPSSWPSVSQPEVPKDPVAQPDDDELPRWNTTRRIGAPEQSLRYNLLFLQSI